MASTYDLASYDPEDEREYDPAGPPKVNIFAAAAYLDSLFHSNGINYAIMGGLAMICRGSQRSTLDIDMVVDAKMVTLWKIITPESRLKIPNTRLVEGAIRIFVATGPEHNDHDCSVDKWIEVDMMTPGFKGSPAQVLSHAERIPVMLGQQQLELACVDILYMVRSKLRNSVTRQMARDIEDLRFLLDNFPTEVSNIQSELDMDEVEELLEQDWTTYIPQEVMARYRQLLGR